MYPTTSWTSFLRRLGRNTKVLKSVVFFIILILVLVPALTIAQKPEKTSSTTALPATPSPASGLPSVATPTPVPLLQVTPMTPVTPESLKKQQEKNAIPIEKVETNLVNLTVTVSDRDGHYYPGLSKENFEIYEIFKGTDKKEHRIKQEISFFSNDDTPINLGVLLDISGSMEGDKIRNAVTAITTFLDYSNDHDAFFLYGFNTKTYIIQDFIFNDSAIRSTSANKLLLIRPKGRTSLIDATYVSVEKLQHGKLGNRMALVLISDGQDNESRYTMRELKRSIRESGVIIYTIGILPSVIDTRPDPLIAGGKNVLDEIASMTGGRSLYPNFSRNFPIQNPFEPRLSLDDAMQKIAIELRHQYVLAYYPTGKDIPNADKNNYRKIKIKLVSPKNNRLPSLSIRTKDGYYGPRTNL